ncbi:MAG: hypothetical protein AAFX90_04865 [Pseudomonadota bacterium]
MAVTHLSLEDLKSVVRAGAGLRINAASFSPDSLASIARAAKGKGVAVVMEECGHLPVDAMTTIARAGNGCVIFE